MNKFRIVEHLEIIREKEYGQTIGARYNNLYILQVYHKNEWVSIKEFTNLQEARKCKEWAESI